MTNQLFRDYLDGRISQPPKPHSLDETLDWYAATGNFAAWHLEHIRQILENDPQPMTVPLGRGKSSTASIFKRHYLGECAADQEPPPADQRARALHQRDHRNTGPQPANLTQRGRITKYRTKG